MLARDLVADIDDADPWCRWRFGTTAGTGWIDGAAWLSDDAATAAFHRLLQSTAQGRRDVAAAYLGALLVDTLATGLALAMARHRCVLDVAAEAVAIHTTATGWVDGVAIDQDVPVVVLRGDPLAEAAGIRVVETERALADAYAAAVTDFAGRAYESVRRVHRCGRTGLWGGLVDAIANAVLWDAQAAGADRDRAWARGVLLVDAIARAEPSVRGRPRRQVIGWSGGEWHQTVRSVCCLAYKVADDPDPHGEGYCNSCPLRPDDVRVRRLAAWCEHRATAD